jgi:hypothetical protein
VQPAEDGDEPDIRRRIEALAQAVCAMDIDAVRSIYAPDMVSFDIEPPLQHLGAKAKRATARFRRIGGSGALRTITSPCRSMATEKPCWISSPEAAINMRKENRRVLAP